MTTLITGYAISNAICAVVIALLWLQNRRRLAGPGFWLAGFTLIFFDPALAFVSDVSPHLTAVSIGSELLLGGLILLLIGLERFIGQPSNQRRNIILLALFAAAHAYFALLNPNPAALSTLFALGMLIVCAQCAHLMLRRATIRQYPYTRPLGALFIAFCLVSIGRIIHLDWLAPAGAFEITLVMVYQTLFILLTFNLFLTVNRRLFDELERDIIARERAEAALQRSRDLLNEVQHLTQVGGWEWDVAAQTMTWNDETYRIHGFTEAEIASGSPELIQRSAACYTPEDRPRIMAAFERCVKEGTPYDLEVPFTTVQGEKKWIRTSGKAILENGCVVRVIGNIMDITERQNLQSHMIISEKLAGLGTLSAGIAHELNSPLQVVTGVSSHALQHLDKENPPDAAFLRRSLETIKRNGWRCAAIVQSLLTYAHPSAGNFHREDLDALIEDTLLLTRYQIEKWSGITITTELQTGLPPLVCDRNQISQLLINLLTNARDAMPGGGQIIIRTACEAGCGGIILQVQDSGPGIPDEIQKNIFDPFFTTKPVGEGAGLGLYVAASVVQVHGGSISVSNVEPNGALFTIKLPTGGPDVPTGSTLQGGRYTEN